MKILHCLNSPNIGGIERLVIELAIIQKKEGMDVAIMFDTIKGPYYEYIKKQDISILESGIKGGFDFSIKAIKNLKQKFNDFQIIHLHSFSPIRSLSTKFSSAKVVYTIHGLSKGIRKESLVKTFFREGLKSFFLNRVDEIVGNSNYTLNHSIIDYGLKKVKSSVVLNGIKVNNQKGLIQDKGHKEMIVGLISRFDYNKRVERLVYAFDAYLKKGGLGRLILVGDGAAYEEIQELVNSLKLKENVDLVGYKNNIEDYYETFDVFVFPCQQEAFGLVTIEAYLFGMPTLAFEDSGGVKEVVEGFEPDDIVEDIELMTERLLFYFNNRDQVYNKVNDRVNYAKENFSVEKMERNYFKVYQSVLNNV